MLILGKNHLKDLMMILNKMKIVKLQGLVWVQLIDWFNVLVKKICSQSYHKLLVNFSNIMIGGISILQLWLFHKWVSILKKLMKLNLLLKKLWVCLMILTLWLDMLYATLLGKYQMIWNLNSKKLSLIKFFLHLSLDYRMKMFLVWLHIFMLV